MLNEQQVIMQNLIKKSNKADNTSQKGSVKNAKVIIKNNSTKVGSFDKSVKAGGSIKG